MNGTQYKIAVIGGTSCSESSMNVASEVGRAIVAKGHCLYTGGVGGIGSSAVDAAAEIDEDKVFQMLPDAPCYARMADECKGTLLLRGMNMSGRQAELVKEVDGCIVISGGYGTHKEVGYTKNRKKPLIPVCFETHEDRESRLNEKENIEKSVKRIMEMNPHMTDVQCRKGLSMVYNVGNQEYFELLESSIKGTLEYPYTLISTGELETLNVNKVLEKTDDAFQISANNAVNFVIRLLDEEK